MTDESQQPDSRELTSADSSADASGNTQRLPSRAVFNPPIDIYETTEGLVLQADLPGVTLETLELQIQDARLTLFGRVTPAVPDGANLLHQEYRVGDFLRSFILSDEVDYERISARLKHGVLTVELPRTKRSAARRIPVSSD